MTKMILAALATATLATGYPGSTGGHAFCWAVDADGLSLACSSEEPSIVLAAAAIGPSSYLTFTVDTATGRCSSLDVQNYSMVRPVTP